MLKLNAGFSRKVGEPNYGSRGASVNVELELESGLIGDPEALASRIRKLFDLARRSVDEELGSTHTDAKQPRSPDDGRRSTNNDGDQPVRYATVSQARAIRAICRQQQIDPDRLANERFRVTSIEELTVREASSLIDELKASQGSGRNGGGR
ncbi:MAG: hypothetical protein ACYSVY_20640 [Planctomycetota bacterium]|jgi:hypothetical protein